MKAVIIESLTEEYCKLKYPTQTVCEIYQLWMTSNPYYITKLCRDLELDRDEAVLSDHIFVEFDNTSDAMKFCNSVPDGDPYCVVIENGKIVHENS